MRSPTFLHENRTYGPQNFSSPVQNDFCNTICHFQTPAVQQRLSANSGHRINRSRSRPSGRQFAYEVRDFRILDYATLVRVSLFRVAISRAAIALTMRYEGERWFWLNSTGSPFRGRGWSPSIALTTTLRAVSASIACRAIRSPHSATI